MPRCRRLFLSIGGRNSAPTCAFSRQEMSIFSSSAFSTISLRNDGVPTKALIPSPPIATTCISVWPTPVVSQADRRERSEEHTSELQSLTNLVCRLLLEKKK